MTIHNGSSRAGIPPLWTSAFSRRTRETYHSQSEALVGNAVNAPDALSSMGEPTARFICRTDFCAKVTRQKKNGLYVFTYAGDGDTDSELVHLRSGRATVVIDTMVGKGRGMLSNALTAARNQIRKCVASCHL